MAVTTKWQNNETNELFKAILKLKTSDECEMFFRDLLTLDEIKEFGKRFRIARELYNSKKTYIEIAKESRSTTATVTRVALWLKNGMGGYRLILERLFK
jgi:TrpR-related protein YerC/YecD